MNSLSRISFFIVLSFALHLLWLPLNQLSSAESFKNRQVGVSFVSRSIDSFYSMPAPKKSTSHVVMGSVQKVKKNLTIASEQFHPVIPETGLKKKSTVSEIVNIAATDLLLNKTTNKFEAIKSDTVVIENINDSLSVETIPEKQNMDLSLQAISSPLMSIPVNSAIQAKSDYFISEGVKTQNEGSDNSQNSTSAATGQASNIEGQGFKDALPRYVVNTPPRYPDVAKLRGWEGKVVFEALILKNGRVGHLDILASSGYRSLDRAARKAINRWKFRPATSFGVAIDSQVEIPVTFSLRNL